MIECKCIKCNRIYTLSDDYAHKHVRCKKCGYVIVVENIPTNETMPDFNSLFTALAEQERQAPTLEDSRIGALS